MYMGVLHAWCPGRLEADIGSHGIGVIDRYEPLRRCWKLKMDLL